MPRMDVDHGSLYLDLLKKALTDYLRTDSDYANAMPLELAFPKSPLKRFRNRLLVSLLGRSHLLVTKSDRRTPEQRRAERESGVGWPPQADTMIGLKRLDNLQFLIETVLKEGIPGDLIETGVWRGGACIFMRAVLKVHGVTDRLVWACDSFEGLPPPDPETYPADAGDIHHTFGFTVAPLDLVRWNFEKYGLLDDQVRFVKGFFEDTLAHIPADEFALLRLDGDMYGSTMVALRELYPRLSDGGFVIIDDYYLPNCARAVDDFRRQEGISSTLHRIDEQAVYFRKVRG